MAIGRVWRFGAPLAIALIVACSSGSPKTSAGSGGAGGTVATGGSVGPGGAVGAGGSKDAGTDASVFVDGGPPARPFWCRDYQTNNQATPPGWVAMSVVVMTVGYGGMTSPIQDCQVGAGDWSVSASGTESDGVDQTTMQLRISGTYQGPGRYAGTLAQGMSYSFSHSDLGPVVFASVPSSECEFCVNDDGLSGTLSCWGLETPPGSDLEVAHVVAGAFTCPNAAAKPADAPTDAPAVGGLSNTEILCHYLQKLNCSGRPADATCIMHGDQITLNGPCQSEWSAWESCFVRQRPSLYQCDSGDLMKVTSGACSTESAALTACRAAAPGTGGSGGGGSSGTAGTGGLTGIQASPECAAFCANVTSKCGFPCTPATDCHLYAGDCEAGARDFLACAAQGDNTFCGTNNWIIVGCSYNAALCSDGGTRG